MDSVPVEYLMELFLCFFWPPPLALDLIYHFSIGKDLSWAEGPRSVKVLRLKVATGRHCVKLTFVNHTSH